MAQLEKLENRRTGGGQKRPEEVTELVKVNS